MEFTYTKPTIIYESNDPLFSITATPKYTRKNNKHTDYILIKFHHRGDGVVHIPAHRKPVLFVNDGYGQFSRQDFSLNPLMDDI